jgi:hypothetical protein
MASDDDIVNSFLNPEMFPDEQPAAKKSKFTDGDITAQKESSTSLLDSTAECVPLNFHGALVESVAFTSDHQVGGTKLLSPSPAAAQFTYPMNAPVANGNAMANGTFNSIYGEAVQIFPKPDWINDLVNPVRSDPISHTKNTNVTANVTFSVILIGNPIRITRVEGVARAPVAGLSFDENVDIAVNDSGPVVVPVTSTATLPDRVSVVTDTIDWFLTIDGVREAVGFSGPHDVLLTFGLPLGAMQWLNGAFDQTAGGQHVTEARLRFAIAAVIAGRANVAGFNDATEKHHVDAVFLHLTAQGVDYALGYRWTGNPVLNLTFLTDNTGAMPSLHHYLWLCATHDARGECHVIGAAFILVCQLLGAAAPFELGFMFPWPSRQDDPVNGYPKRNNDPIPSAPRTVARPGVYADYQPSIKGKFSVDYTGRYLRTTGRLTNDGTLPAQALYFVDFAGNGNTFEGAARYAGTHLYAIGDMILDTEASSDLHATIYFTMHNRNAGSRKITYVHANGKFRLEFARTDNNAIDPTPYRQNDGNEAFPYTMATVDGTPNVATFYWQN